MQRQGPARKLKERRRRRRSTTGGSTGSRREVESTERSCMERQPVPTKPLWRRLQKSRRCFKKEAAALIRCSVGTKLVYITKEEKTLLGYKLITAEQEEEGRDFPLKDEKDNKVQIP